MRLVIGVEGAVSRTLSYIPIECSATKSRGSIGQRELNLKMEKGERGGVQRNRENEDQAVVGLAPAASRMNDEAGGTPPGKFEVQMGGVQAVKENNVLRRGSHR